MNQTSSQTQIRNICLMLFELASGNLDYRMLSPEGEFEELMTELNLWANSFRQNILNTQMGNPHFDYHSISQYSLMVNSQGNILHFSDSFSATLGYLPATIAGYSITLFMHEDSLHLWRAVIKKSAQNENYSRTISINWLNHHQKIVPALCTVTRHHGSADLLICAVTTQLDDKTAPEIKSQKPEALLVKELYRFIVENLEEPLPTARQLTSLFSTNEFKLKTAFRQYFKVSIYQFYNNERLKKAHTLIQNTNYPLKEITFQCGFNDYPNFSKAFRRKFGYAPSDLKRNNE